MRSILDIVKHNLKILVLNLLNSAKMKPHRMKIADYRLFCQMAFNVTSMITILVEVIIIYRGKNIRCSLLPSIIQ